MRLSLLFLSAILFFVSCKEPKIKVEVKAGLYNSQELAKFLPAEIKGYKPTKVAAGKDINDSLPNMMRRHFSSACRVYFKNNDSIKVDLVDLILTPGYYKLYSGLWIDAQYEHDSLRVVEYLSYGKNNTAWAVYDKPHNNTMIYINASERFHMTYECSGNRRAFLKDAAAGFDYEQFGSAPLSMREIQQLLEEKARN